MHLSSRQTERHHGPRLIGSSVAELGAMIRDVVCCANIRCESQLPSKRTF
jgi:hypothetical protein